jgi:hypothetical protein
VLFLDTCHAAGAIENGSRRGLARLDINSVINEFASAENGVVAFASSTGREDSVENDAWQNGAFTKALVEGLRAGWADLLHTGTITLTQFDAFVVLGEGADQRPPTPGDDSAADSAGFPHRVGPLVIGYVHLPA